MSNRKKLRRHGGTSLGGKAVSQEVMLRLLAGFQAMDDEMQARDELRAEARRTWCGGKDPVPAELPCWPEDSLGDRFFSGMLLADAMQAPSLMTAVMPAPRVIAADSAHWNVAVSVLVRAVLLDGVPADDPQVKALLGVLAPVAEAEYSYGQAANLAVFGIGTAGMGDEPEFPEEDGPISLLGTLALIDAIWAVIGEDPLQEILDVLTPLLDEALPELGGQVVAEALVRAFSHHYRCEMPGDDKVLERLARPGPGNPLEDLVTARVVTPADAPRVGLTVLATLAELCRSGSASVLQVVAA
jgi:hypothetical protein